MKMTFADAVRSGFKNYSNFKGTATRTEFWYFYLFNVLLNVVTYTIDLVIDPSTATSVTGGPVYLIANIALILPNLTVAVRRFHDAGFSGKWMFLWVLPFVALFLGGGAVAASAPALEPSTVTNEQLLAIALPLLPSLLLFAAVGIFQLVINLKMTKTPEQGNKYATPTPTETSASE